MELILFGTGRSGTTILMEALFQHPDLAYFSNYLEKKPSMQNLNYLRWLFNNPIYRLTGGKRELEKNSYWNRLIFKPSEAYPIWSFLTKDEDLNFSRSFMHMQKASPILQKRIQKYVSQVKKIQGKPHFAAKLTGPSRLNFLHSVFPNAYYIRLTRAFLPVLKSFMLVNFWQERKTGQVWWQGPYTEREKMLLREHRYDPLIFTGLQLKKIIEISDSEQDSLGEKVIALRYEDFVGSPKNTLDDVLSYVGLYPASACFDFLERHKIVNRNLEVSKLFNSQELKALENALGEDFLACN